MSKDIHMLLKKRRKERGLTQVAFAAALSESVAQSVVSDWESGKLPIPDSRIPDIAAVLGIDPEELRSASRYLKGEGDVPEWLKVAVQVKGLSKDAKMVLMALPAFLDEPDGSTAHVTFGALSDALEVLTPDQVEAVSREVLKTGLAETYRGVPGAFRLKFPANS